MNLNARSEEHTRFIQHFLAQFFGGCGWIRDEKDAALVVTVTIPLASSNLAAATARPGRTLDVLGQYKISILQMFLYNLI